MFQSSHHWTSLPRIRSNNTNLNQKKYKCYDGIVDKRKCSSNSSPRELEESTQFSKDNINSLCGIYTSMLELVAKIPGTTGEVRHLQGNSKKVIKALRGPGHHHNGSSLTTLSGCNLAYSNQSPSSQEPVKSTSVLRLTGTVPSRFILGLSKLTPFHDKLTPSTLVPLKNLKPR